MQLSQPQDVSTVFRSLSRTHSILFNHGDTEDTEKKSFYPQMDAD